METFIFILSGRDYNELAANRFYIPAKSRSFESIILIRYRSLNDK